MAQRTLIQLSRKDWPEPGLYIRTSAGARICCPRCKAVVLLDLEGGTHEDDKSRRKTAMNAGKDAGAPRKNNTMGTRTCPSCHQVSGCRVGPAQPIQGNTMSPEDWWGRPTLLILLIQRPDADVPVVQARAVVLEADVPAGPCQAGMILLLVDGVVQVCVDNGNAVQRHLHALVHPGG